MPSRKLPHYLRSHRKRIGFSQRELAWLLGCRKGSKVSRYERFTRKPGLETVFAYEILFQTSSCDLFSGIYEAIRQITHRRVETLIKRLTTKEPTPEVTAKLTALRAIVAPKVPATHLVRRA